MILIKSTAHSPSFPSLHLRHSSFPNPSLALPTSQLILQPIRCFIYVTAHSPTLLSLLLRHRIFTYVTWRAAHAVDARKWSDKWRNLNISLPRALPFLCSPYVSIKTKFLITTNDTGWERSMLFTSQSMTIKQRGTSIRWLRACGTHTPDFFNLAHCMKMHDAGMVTVHHICQFSSTLTWIIVD